MTKKETGSINPGGNSNRPTTRDFAFFVTLDLIRGDGIAAGPPRFERADRVRAINRLPWMRYKCSEATNVARKVIRCCPVCRLGNANSSQYCMKGRSDGGQVGNE